MQKGDGGRKGHRHKLGPDQIEQIINALGIQKAGETDSHFMVWCPVHNNINTSSATISKEYGTLYCFGAGCGVQMSLVELVQEIRGCDLFPALRFIRKYETETDIAREIQDVFATDNELPKFDLDLLSQMQNDFWVSPRAQKYIASRKITKQLAESFGIGYDKSQDMVVTPMFDINENCVGVIGRSIEGKRFKNSFNLPTSKTLFNFNRARKQSTDTLILTEANFDTILATGAGFPNTAACLGGSFTDYHVTQVSRSFSRLIIATDNDEAGHSFAKRIARKCRGRGLSIYRMKYDVTCVLPDGKKDFGDLTRDEIIQTIKNAEPLAW